MGYYLSNSSNELVGVCLLFRDERDPATCSTSLGFRKVAWFNIAPGQTLLPDLFNYPLTQNNGYSGLFAYSSSTAYNSNQPYTGLNVTTGAPFDQCMEDDANCPWAVTFYDIDFSGHDVALSIIGAPNTGVLTVFPTASIRPVPDAPFAVEGLGFPANSVLNVQVVAESSNGSTEDDFQLTTDPWGNCTGFPALDGWVLDGSNLQARVTLTDSVFGEFTSTSYYTPDPQ